jgi:hypothetical protein
MSNQGSEWGCGVVGQARSGPGAGFQRALRLGPGPGRAASLRLGSRSALPSPPSPDTAPPARAASRAGAPARRQGPGAAGNPPGRLRPRPGARGLAAGDDPAARAGGGGGGGDGPPPEWRPARRGAVRGATERSRRRGRFGPIGSTDGAAPGGAGVHGQSRPRRRPAPGARIPHPRPAWRLPPQLRRSNSDAACHGAGPDAQRRAAGPAARRRP